MESTGTPGKSRDGLGLPTDITKQNIPMEETKVPNETSAPMEEKKLGHAAQNASGGRSGDSSIDVLSSFILGACTTLADGISKVSAGELPGVNGNELFLAKCDSNGLKEGHNARAQVEIKSFFSSPDKAGGGPVSSPDSPAKPQSEQPKFGTTNALHRIAKEGNWKTLRTQLTSASDHSETVKLAGEVDGKGRTPLMLACLHGASFPADVARLLLVANNKSASIYVLQKNGGRQYCLHVATTAGCSIEVLDILHGAYPKAASTPDGNGNMPLHLAVTNGKYRSISGRMGARADDAASTVVSGTGPPMAVITERRRDESPARSTISFDSKLTDGGATAADLDDDNESVATVICTGAVTGYEENLLNVCDFLITANQSALLHRNRRGETPLLLAIYRRSPSDVLSLLLVRGGTASLKISDDSGSHPIHFCNRSPSISIVRDMADLYPGAIMHKNKLGDTPLYNAMSDDCSLVTLRVLLECCPKPQNTVIGKNNSDLNVIRHGWESLTAEKVVAAEDQEEEDSRLETNKSLIESACGPMDISKTHLGLWWDKTTLLLQAAYHNTVKSDLDGLLNGRVWRPVHAAAGTECPPSAVKFILQIYSDEAGYTDENLSTPLHIGASRPDIIGLETMKLLLGAHPSSASMQNQDGYTPLHVACLYKAPLEILQLLIDACPDATCMTNNVGQTPLFIAIAMGSPVDVLRALLAARPESVHIRDENGLSTIALAWQLLLNGKITEEKGIKVKEEIKRSKANISSLSVISRSSSLKGDVRTWMSKIDMLLRASFHNTVDEPLPKGKQWRAVHAACAGGTVPPDVLAFALQILPGEVEVVNESGNLPIHIASFAPPDEANIMPEIGSGRPLKMLLDMNAKAATKSNRKGRLALHLALASGKTWNSGVREILKAFPEATRMRDPVTLLYPFMLAACENEGSAVYSDEDETVKAIERPVDNKQLEHGKGAAELASINTIYSLLRAAPKFISESKSDAEKCFLWRSRKELAAERDQLKDKLFTVETNLRKRMTAVELQDIEDKKKQEMAHKQEEERHSRANHLELSAQTNAKVINTIGGAMMTLKDTGL